MTVQDVDNAFRKKADASVKLFGLRKKIENGTATMEDAAQYQTMLSKILGQTIGESILNIPESERVKFLDWILRNQYQEANDRLAVIQKFLDKQQGIHIAPQKAPFPAERVEKLGKSLTDPTVPDSTIRRRARAGTETVSKSFHDDYVKTNAKFRSRAGLKCFITRKAVSGCCEWCTAMAGRYAYGEEPDDIYRRHDNCDCTVTFENGRKRQDVWSKREWEAPDKDAGAADATVFTDETRPNGTQVTVFSPLTAEERQQSVLTLSHISATIEVGSIPDQFKRYVPPREERIAIIQRGIQNPDAVFSDGRLASFARCLEPLEGYYDVVMHGNAESIQFFDTQIDVQTLGAIIMGRKDYQRGTKIRLISCETGKGAECVAKYLSEMLGVEVLAPTEKVTIMMPVGGKSSMIVQSGPHKRDGEWKKFGGSEE